MQTKIEDVVKKSTLMWKVIYGLQTIKQAQEDPFEGRNDDEEEEENEKEEEGEKEKEEGEIKGRSNNGEGNTER